MCLRFFRQDLFNNQTFDASPVFEDVFEVLLNARDLCAENENLEDCETSLSEQLQGVLAKDNQRLLDLPRHESYSRHVIGVRDEWVAYICRWEKDVTSCVHGHPWFAYYQVIDGTLDMDLYERCDGATANNSPNRELHESVEKENPDLEPVRHVSSQRMKPGDIVWSAGKRGQYDNLIHRVSSGAQPGFTLHLFSENPGLGEHYRVLAG